MTPIETPELCKKELMEETIVDIDNTNHMTLYVKLMTLTTNCLTLCLIYYCILKLKFWTYSITI